MLISKGISACLGVKQLFYELSVVLVAMTTFNNILLCVCTEWKVLDFCLFLIGLMLGRKRSEIVLGCMPLTLKLTAPFS